MENFERIECPFCGESFEVQIDPETGDQRFTTDCEICCRPMEVIVKCEDGKVASVEVAGSG
jgi:Cysteine-rich CPXCG